MRIIPLASICGSTVSCGSITATPEVEIVAAVAGENLRQPRRRVDLEGGGAEIAQHGVIAGLVGLVEGEQRGAHQDQHPVAVDLRRLRLLRMRGAGGGDRRHHQQAQHRPPGTRPCHHAPLTTCKLTTKVAPTRLPTPWC